MGQPTVTAPGENFRKQVEALRKYAENEGKVATGEEWPVWYIPDGWEGDALNIEGLGTPFDASEHEQSFNKALAGEQSGTVGDLMASQLQGDWLAETERSFRSCLRSSVRNKIHAAGRRFGHGHEQGVFKVGVLGFIERIIKNSAG